MATQVWSSSHKAASVTLSAGNLTGTATANNAYAGCFGANAVSSGKYYWEVVKNYQQGADNGTGIGLASTPTNIYLGQDTTSLGWYSEATGVVWYGDALLGTWATHTSGSRLCLALDLTNNRIWGRVGAGNWNNSATANPATNTGGLALPAGLVGQSLVPAFNLFQNGQPDSTTASFTRTSWQNTAPSGFIAFDEVGASALPLLDHIVVIIDENHAFTQIVGNTTEAPYFNNTIIANGCLLTNYLAITHPSEGNYLALYYGSDFGVTDDNDHPRQPPDLYTVLNAAGLTFKGYAEPLIENKHTPWNYVPGESALVQVNFTTGFPTNFANLPKVSWIVPNANDNMHDGTIGDADSWKQSHLETLRAYASNAANKTLLIFTFDEDDDSGGNNRVTTVLYGAGVKPGTTDATAYNHYSMLASVLVMCGISQSSAPLSASTATLFSANNFNLTAAGFPLAPGRGLLQVAGLVPTVTASTGTGSPQSWSTTHKSSNISLSGTNNVIATKTGNDIDAVVYASNGFTTGKYYWEITATAISAGHDSYGIGLTTSTTPDGNWLGNTTDTFSWAQDGGLWNSSGNPGSWAAWTTGNRLCFAIDIGARLIWGRVNGGNWNNSGTANPATGVGGLAIPAGITGGIVPAVNIYNGVSSPTSVATANFDQTSWSFTAPTGFTPFSGGAPGGGGGGTPPGGTGGGNLSKVNDFLNSIGVVTSAVFDTPLAAQKSTVISCGFRMIRIALDASVITDWGSAFAAGVRICVLTPYGVNNLSTIINQIAQIETTYPGAVAFIEGPNEANNFGFTYNGVFGGFNNQTGQEFSYAPISDYMRDLYAAVKANAVLKNKIVITPTDAGAQLDDCGQQFTKVPAGHGTARWDGVTLADGVACHPYASGSTDSSFFEATVANNGNELAQNNITTWRGGFSGMTVAQLKAVPLVSTECGISAGEAGSSEALQNSYVSNQFFSFFANGWSAALTYVVGDEPSYDDSNSSTPTKYGQYGICYVNGTLHPVGNTIKNITTILKDTTSAFTSVDPGGVTYTGLGASVHALLMQHSDGAYWVGLWNETRSGNASVTINFGFTSPSVRVYNPASSSTATSSPTNVASQTVSVPATPMLVRFTPAAATTSPSTVPVGKGSVVITGNTPTPVASGTGGGTKTIILTSGSSWTVPSDWSNANNKIEVIGGGGGGANGTSQVSGGGAAYSAVSNIALTPGQVINYSIGAGGAGGSLTANDPNGNYGYSGGATGGDTWFGGTQYSNSTVAAKGGGGGPADTGTSTPGGAASAGRGTTRFSGGLGYFLYTTDDSSPSGGGGAGGPNGNGGAGGTGSNGIVQPHGTTAAVGGGGGGGGSAGGADTYTNSQPARDNANGTVGGSNWQGTGGGAGGTSASPNGKPGTNGGGGGGGYSNFTTSVTGSGGVGGNGTEWGTAGSGGGGGGGGHSWTSAGGFVGGHGGLYGGGGGAGAYAGTWGPNGPTSGGYGFPGGNGAPGVIAITYTAPITAVGATSFPGRGLLSLNGQLPTVTALTGPQTSTPGKGALAIAGKGPTVSTTNNIPVTVAPLPGSLLLQGNAPIPVIVGPIRTIITTGTAFTVPQDWNNSSNSIECIGGGGGGTEGWGGSGGGGGAYARVTNVTLTRGASVQISVGAAGAGAVPRSSYNDPASFGGNGGNTWFNGTSLATSLCGAQGGLGGTGYGGGTPGPGGTGGTATASVGTTKFSGGEGGHSWDIDSGAGGGAAGPNGAGANSGATSTTQGGAANGAPGGGGGGGGSQGGSKAAAPTVPGGAGGNNYLGTGGGAAGTTTSFSGGAGTNGGGGGGGAGNASSIGAGGKGGDGAEWITAGSGGGGGAGGTSGSVNTTAAVGGAGGLYGGAGGSGGWAGAATLQGNRGGNGAQGVIVVTYTPVNAATTVTVEVGNLNLSSRAPFVLTGTLLVPGLGQCSLAGKVPVPLVGATLVPGLGNVALNGFVPNPNNSGQVNQPGRGTLTVTGNAPAAFVAITAISAPLKGALTIAGSAPLTPTAPIARPGAGVITIIGFSPSLSVTTTKLVLSTGASFTVPGDWSATNSIECIGGGGGGSSGGVFFGGGGGAYSKISNIVLSPGASVPFQIGAGGSGGIASSISSFGVAGGDTWFSSTSTILAKGGSAAFAITSPETWNPAQKSANITLSNSNLTGSAGGTNATYSACFGTGGVNSGKFYWEVVFVVSAGTEAGVGIGTAGTTPTNIYLGADTTSIGWYGGDGQIWYGDASLSIWATYPSGSRLCFALDLTNDRFWGRVGNGPWNNSSTANPATNTGGLILPAGMATAMLVPAFSTFNTTIPDSAVGYFTAGSWVQAAPSGFIAFDAAAGSGTGGIGGTPVLGGQAASGIGTVKFSGGTGAGNATGTIATAGGGGGAGGPNGNGAAGGDTSTTPSTSVNSGTFPKVNDFLWTIGIADDPNGAAGDSVRFGAMRAMGIRLIRGTPDAATLSFFASELSAGVVGFCCFTPYSVDNVNTYIQNDVLPIWNAYPGCIKMHNGPNEAGNFGFTYQGVNSGLVGNTVYAMDSAADYQRDLYAAFKANSSLKDILVLGPSESGRQPFHDCGLMYLTVPSNKGTARWDGATFAEGFDVHPYPSSWGWLPSDMAAANTVPPSFPAEHNDIYHDHVDNGAWVGIQSTPHLTAYTTAQVAQFPKVATETGLSSMEQDGNGNVLADESMQAAWNLGMYFAGFTQGWKGICLYTTCDLEGPGGTTWDIQYHGYGQATINGTLKASGRAIQALTTILSDTSSNFTSVDPGSISFTGLTTKIRAFAMQHSDGSYWAAIWNESYATPSPTSGSVTVNFGFSSPSVRVYDPMSGSATVSTASNVTSQTVTLNAARLIRFTSPTGGVGGGTTAGAGGSGGGGASGGTKGTNSPVVAQAPGTKGGNNFVGAGGGNAATTAASPNAAPGTVGGGGGGGYGDATVDGSGGTGGPGNEWVTAGAGGGGGGAGSSNSGSAITGGGGGLYGGGGGAGGTSGAQSLKNRTGGSGSQGVIVVQYQTVIAGTTTIAPGAGALILSGFAPTAALGSVLSVGSGIIQILGYPPSLTVGASVSILPLKGALTLTGATPPVNTFTSVQAGLGALFAAGLAPSVTVPANPIPGRGLLSANGLLPIPGAGQTTPVGAGLISITGRIPAFISGQVQVPTPGNLLVSGTPVSIVVPASTTVGIGSLPITGFGINILTGASALPLPGVGALVITGLLPTVLAGSGTAVSPNPGLMSIDGLLVTAIANPSVVLPVGAGALTVTGLTPAAVIVSTVLLPSPGALTIVGLAPVASVDPGANLPGAGNISFFSGRVSVLQGASVLVGLGNSQITGQQPSLTLSATTVPFVGSLRATGLIPGAAVTGTTFNQPSVGTMTVAGLVPNVLVLVTTDQGTETLAVVVPTDPNQETVANTTLFHLAAQDLGDPTQWDRIAATNKIDDPLITNPQTITIPSQDPDAGGGTPPT